MGWFLKTLETDNLVVETGKVLKVKAADWLGFGFKAETSHRKTIDTVR